MKPLNLDNSPCSPISSNCVVWQGPDIPCINLCKGDTVSDVVYKLAEELCCVLTILDINSYDLSCFNAGSSKPEDFKAFIQFLTEKICELEGIPMHTHDGENGECPDNCIVTVAEPFRDDDRSTMNLVDYAKAMGNKIADNIDEINLNKTAISNHEVRIVSLETTPPPTFTLPSITPDCVLPSIPTLIDQVLSALESDYCNLRTSTGLPTEISVAVANQTVADSDISKFNPSNTMSTEYSGLWISPSTTLADSVTNLWLALSDFRNASEPSVAVNSSDTIDISLSILDREYTIEANIVDTGWVNLEGFNHYPLSIPKPQVRKIGKTLQFRGLVYIPLSNDGGATLIPLLAATSYYDEYYVAPFTGTGGVILDSNGALYFNSNASVIPISVLPAADLLDSTYKKSGVIATRAIDLDATYGTALTAYGAVSITSDKKLLFQVLKDLEITATNPAGYKGSSALRFITSDVRQGEYVPDYTSTNTYIHNGGRGASTVTINTAGSGYTDGTYSIHLDGGSGRGLIVTVTITAGAVVSVDGIVEAGVGYSNTDTGLTSTELDNLAGGTLATFDVTAVSNSPYSIQTEVRNITWPFSCDAGEETDLGGFTFFLDGLTAYID